MAVTPNSIITPQTVKTANKVQAFVAQTDISTPTPANAVLLLTAGVNGGRLVKLLMWPLVTVTATQLQLWSSKDAGVTKQVAALALGGAYTLAATTAPTAADFGFSDLNPLMLDAGEQLYVAGGVVGTWGTRGEWMDY